MQALRPAEAAASFGTLRLLNPGAGRIREVRLDSTSGYAAFGAGGGPANANL